jgi:RHS repeat-associated protein
MTRHLLALIAAASLLSGAYTYYYSDALTTINGANWFTNGSVSATSSGLTATASTGGSLISKIAVPDASSDYEVKARLALPSQGGTYTIYTRASDNALAGSPPQGTFYAVEIENPTIWSGGFTADLRVYKVINNAVTELSWTMAYCRNGMEVRVVQRPGQLGVFLDNHPHVILSDNGITSGKPGIGGRGMPAGNSISLVELGPLDRVAPGAVPPTSVGTSVFANRYDAQWQGVSDDANGAGLAYYTIYRNGSWFANITRPTYSDATVSPSTTYTIRIDSMDRHLNWATSTINIVTPSAGSIDPRRVGIHPNGAYWGEGKEQIDLQSGNLNYTFPLIKAQSRGWSVGVGLNYNSQNWRKDPGGVWKLGRDSGYGWGWKLNAGSLRYYFSNYWTISHVGFTDSTGSEHRLEPDPSSSARFISKDGTYLTLDTTTWRLYFNNGSFWQFSAVAEGIEEDAGTYYPTLMQDTNGNQITMNYAAGSGVGYANSSGRITQIWDVRGSYTFTYTTCSQDPTPKLTQITNNFSSGEAYTFAYDCGVALIAPFDSVPHGTESQLREITHTPTGLKHNLEYQLSGSSYTGELRKITLPYGGYFRYVYGETAFQGNRNLRAVEQRILSKNGVEEKTYSFSRDVPNNTGGTVHAYTRVRDASLNSEKEYQFHTGTAEPWKLGLLYKRIDRELSTVTTDISVTDQTWAQHATSGNPYIASVIVVQDPTVPAITVQKKTEQSIDQYGNLSELKQYDWNSLVNPIRTYKNKYVIAAPYVDKYIRNRLLESKVNSGGPDLFLVVNTYDTDTQSCGYPSPLVAPPAFLWDSSVTAIRGNVTVSQSPAGTTYTCYDQVGAASKVRSPTGQQVTITNSATNSYAAPIAITQGGLTENLSWNSFLGLTGTSGPNGVSTSVIYDSAARPSTTISPHGSATSYVYGTNPPTITATVGTNGGGNGRWTRTTLDGLGRPIKVESGPTGGAATSVTESEYEPCACSPTGKLKRTTMPFAPTAAKKWKTFTYDALGRTVTVQEADGVSNTTYLYEGATVKVTDPAGKWKKFFMNGLGQLWKVEEPRPGGGTYTTTYTYDLLGNLTGVNMPRDGVTQTRTFNYTGPYLTSVTQPESGTTNYIYSGSLIIEKVDADNRKTTWEYDPYGRVTAVKAWLWQQVYNEFSGLYQWTWNEQLCQRKEFFYDSNPFDASYSENTQGRLAAVRYTPCASVQTFIEMYSYTPGGLTIKKRFRVDRNGFTAANLDGVWTYDNEGKMTSVAVPLGPQYSYVYNSMGRPYSVTQSNTEPPTAVVSATSYGPAGELLAWNGETRTYNDRLQLTSITGGGRNITYSYNNAANNGQLFSQTENGETIAYQYDSLKRLISATASGSMTWTQTYSYDGFGNLLSKTGSGNGGGGGPVSASYLINPATNKPFSGYSAAGLPWFTYFDNDNRLLSAGSTSGYTEYFAYSPSGKRVFNIGERLIQPEEGGDPTMQTVQEVWFWSPQGQRLAFYSLTHAGAPVFTFREANVYLGGKLLGQYKNYSFLSWGHFLQISDRLGSFGKYYPYGEERNPTGASGEKFATYFHDNVVNLNYADQRWHATSGRFLTPDPYQASGGPADPGSWNRYAYVGGDPVNLGDRLGLFAEPPGLDPWDPWTPFPYVPVMPPLPPPLTAAYVYLPGFDTWAYQINPGTGTGIVQSANWDVIFSYVIANASTIPFPIPTTGSWTFSTDVIAQILRHFPTLLALAASVGQTSGGSLPPDPDKCPKPEQFWDPSKPPQPGWKWHGNVPPGEAGGHWYNPFSPNMKLIPDIKHAQPKGPHWEYVDPLGKSWECLPDGAIYEKGVEWWKK